MDGGGGRGEGRLYLRLSALWQFGEGGVGGGKRGEGGDEMGREKHKNKRNTGINRCPGHFLSYMYWTGTNKN